MRGAIIFHRQSGQQQGDDRAKHQLLLLRQPVHGGKVTVNFSFGKLGEVSQRSIAVRKLADDKPGLLVWQRFMAAIGRFSKGDEIFYAKVVDGEIFRLIGDVFGSPSYERKPTPRKGV